MKRIIYFVLAILVCGIYAGCSESEIELYNQTEISFLLQFLLA